MKYTTMVLATLFVMSACSHHADAQVKWSVGGNMGLVITTSPSSADFGFGPMSEVLIGKGPAVGTEFNIVTVSGTAVDWSTYFKYYFTIPGSKIKPYANVGFGLLFWTGGPFFNLRFGGGANFEVARNLYIAPDIQMGPVFASGATPFTIAIRGGIRYEVQ
jgi:hypothetical protein